MMYKISALQHSNRVTVSVVTVVCVSLLLLSCVCLVIQ